MSLHHVEVYDHWLTNVSQSWTYFVSEKQRAKVFSFELFFWILVVFWTSDWVILQKFNLDAFFFLRYLCTFLKIFVSLSLIIILILMSLNLVYEKNASNEVQDLNRLSWANMRLIHISFYWAHLIMILIVIIFICHTIYAKLIEYIRIWQTYLASSEHRFQVFANTILVMNILRRFLSILVLTRLYDVFSDEVRVIWINRDLFELFKKILEQRKIVCTLKIAKTKLLWLTMKFTDDRKDHDLTKVEMSDSSHTYVESEESLWKWYLGEKNRDYMRLSIFNLIWMSSISFVKTKVDTLYHCWQEMTRLNNEIDQNQWESERYSLMISAFIQFNIQEIMYMTCQFIIRCTLLCFRSQYLEALSVNVKWKNLFKNWWNRYTWTVLIIIFIIALILAWSISVIFTDLIFQIAYLTTLLSWLHWINTLLTWLFDCIQDVLSQLILIALITLLSYVLRIITERRDLLTKIIIELSLQKYYFTFLFIQVFLMIFLSSSITIVIQEVLHDLNSVSMMLVTNLLNTSNYFFSYLMLRCFSISASFILQVKQLINWYTLVSIINTTLRQKWKKQTALSQMQWDILFSIYINLACINKSLLYHSCIILTSCQSLSTQSLLR